ncbi:MAG TPA: dihydroorotate dehydrogenase-like protein [Bryobacteraceae bacterium]|nr:dihydroorotate dehydrogenase-like protein [Bryobacteraceae bacterium]
MNTKIDLSTTYLGLDLRNPLVCSSSPLCKEIDNLRRMEDCGASAVVLHSLFEEQINIESRLLDRYLSEGESYGEAITYFPDLTQYNVGPEGYLEHIRRAKASLGIPVIASLNGVSSGGWVRYAQLMQQAGADALELNIYYLPVSPELTGQEIEQMYERLVHAVRSTVTIPVAVKVGPSFSAIPNMAKKLSLAGADGLVLFNRFYQPDLDIESLDVKPTVNLSDSSELLLRLHWVGLLHGKVPVDLAITGGVHTPEDVIKSVMAGASAAMMTSSLLRHGIERLKSLRSGVLDWMDAHEYESVRQMWGSLSQQKAAQPAAFERANYMKVLSSYATH